MLKVEAWTPQWARYVTIYPKEVEAACGAEIAVRLVNNSDYPLFMGIPQVPKVRFSIHFAEIPTGGDVKFVMKLDPEDVLSFDLPVFVIRYPPAPFVADEMVFANIAGYHAIYVISVFMENGGANRIGNRVGGGGGVAEFAQG